MITALALLWAGAAHAQDARPVLWNDLRLGMSKDEVKALLPKPRVDLANGCNINAYPRFDDSGLKRVDMEAEWVHDDGKAHCGLVVETALAKKYGEPVTGDGANDCMFQFTRQVSLSGFCGAGSRQRVVYPPRHRYSTWTTPEGVVINFRVDQELGSQRWQAVYEPALKVTETVTSKF